MLTAVGREWHHGIMRALKAAGSRARGVWSDRPGLDWLIAAIVTAIYAVALRLGWMSLEPWGLAKDDRMRLYTTVATVSSLLFGFATASIAFFYGSASGHRVELFKQIMDQAITRTWRAVLGAPLLAVAVTVIALVTDTGPQGSPGIGAAVWVSILLLALRGFRLRWMFVQTLRIQSRDLASSNKQSPTAGITAAPRPTAAKRATDMFEDV